MKTFIFSIFVRGLIALSGLLVFIVSASLFGAEGRGVISYGTSIFASIGLISSLNLGRTFVGSTANNPSHRQRLLTLMLLLTILTVIFTAVAGVVFWLLSDSAQKIISLQVLFPLVATSLFYVWSVTGSSLFAAIQKTLTQDLIILGTRGCLILFLVLFLIFRLQNLQQFLMGYAAILTVGVVVEFVVLYQHCEPLPDRKIFSELGQIVKQSLWTHADFLAFNLYPLLLVLIAGYFLDKSALGRINFAVQIINLIFLFSTTANLRVTAYVSHTGFRKKWQEIKKLMLLTLSASVAAAAVVFVALQFLTKTEAFGSFQGSSVFFAITILAIPGYLVYQFFNPIWLELGWIKRSAKLNLVALAVTLLVTPVLINRYHELGAILIFSLFHLLIMAGQLLLFRRLRQSPS